MASSANGKSPFGGRHHLTIGLAVDGSEFGGAEVSLLNLVRTVSRIDQSVGFVLLGPECRALQSLVERLPSVDTVVAADGFTGVRRALRSHRLDLLQVTLCNPLAGREWQLAGLSLGIPTIVVEQLVRPFGRRSLPLKAGVSRRLADHVAVGTRSAAEIERHARLPPGSVRVIHNGVPPPPAAEPVEPAVPLGAGVDFVLGSVGRLEHQKGFDRLLLLLPRLPSVHLVIVGAGADEGALRSQAAALKVEGRVTFTGWLDDPGPVVRSFDAFVLPSRNEAFPLSIVEAMMRRVPVIATDVGSVGDAVIDGETGWLIPVDRPDLLVDRVQALLAHRRLGAEVADRAADHAQANFTAEAMARSYLAMWADLRGPLPLWSRSIGTAAPAPAPLPAPIPVLSAETEVDVDPAAQPAVHIVICTYNRVRLLRHTLDALAAQDAAHDGRWAVLVVDNNCTDGTAALVDDYRGRLPGLCRVEERRQGLTEARQRGFLATTAPWVAFIDDDCVPEADWVSQALRHIEQRPEVAAFNGRNILHLEDGVARPWIHGEMFAAGGPIEDVEQERPFLHGAGLVLRREAVQRSGWIAAPRAADRRGSSLVSGGDNELALRAKAGGEGGGVWFFPACRMHHTVDEARLGFGYVARLNYRLAEAGALLVAMQSLTLVGWHRFMLRYLAHKLAALIGVRDDDMITPDGGVRSRILAVVRAVGATAGYVRLAVRPNRLRSQVVAIATPQWVEARLRGLDTPASSRPRSVQTSRSGPGQGQGDG